MSQIVRLQAFDAITNRIDELRLSNNQLQTSDADVKKLLNDIKNELNPADPETSVFEQLKTATSHLNAVKTALELPREFYGAYANLNNDAPLVEPLDLSSVTGINVDEMQQSSLSIQNTSGRTAVYTLLASPESSGSNWVPYGAFTLEDTQYNTYNVNLSGFRRASIVNFPNSNEPVDTNTDIRGFVSLVSQSK